MNPQAINNRLIATLVGALLVPKIERATGVKLTTDDVAALVALVPVAWHGIGAIFDRVFPPKQQPVGPA